MDRIPVGTYVKLTYNVKCVISNTPFECETNSEIIKNAHGDILIGGLGIGMILLPIQEKDTINSITVVEFRQEVIDLVAHQLPLNEKVRIIRGDVFEYVPEQKYHTIYLDIWNVMSKDIATRKAIPLLEKY